MNIKVITDGWFKKTKQEQKEILEELKRGLVTDMDNLGIEYELLSQQIKKLEEKAVELEDYESAYVLGEINKQINKERNGWM
jgi:hypothetical protein